MLRDSQSLVSCKFAETKKIHNRVNCRIPAHFETSIRTVSSLRISLIWQFSIARRKMTLIPENIHNLTLTNRNWTIARKQIT